MVYIYALCDPTTKAIRYIGKSKNPQSRLYYHLQDVTDKKVHSHKKYWLRSVLDAGEKPLLKILEVTDSESWANCERKWIAWAKEQGCNLTNGTDGGDGGHSFTLEARAKISKAMSGRASCRKGVNLSEETKEKLRQVNLGKKHSDETKLKVSLSAKGRVAWNKGLTHTEETKAKMSEAQSGSKNHNYGKTGEAASCYGRTGASHPMFGKSHTEEAKQRISAKVAGSNNPMFGRKHSEESRRKISEARKRRT